MKCVCISCFNHYATRMSQIVEYWKNKGDTTYIISDFNHFEKKRYSVSYENTVQIHVPAYYRNLSPQRLWSHYVFSRRTYKLLLQIKPDVIYCMTPPNTLYQQVIRYQKRFQAKVIFDCFDTWPESFPVGGLKKVLAAPFFLWRTLRDHYIGKADMLICVSKEGKDFYAPKCPADMPIQVLEPSIAEAEPPQYNAVIHDTVSFCYLGNINYITDTELAIELLGELAKHIHVTLHIIGEGQNKEQLMEALTEQGVNVVSHGIVFDSEKKREIFSMCHYGLNIPKEEIQSSMSLKSVEYMHAGLPIVNSGLGDNYEGVRDAQLGINIDRNDLEKTVSEILGLSEAQRLEMHENCLRYYDDKFAHQNLDAVFAPVLKMENDS